MTFAGGVIGLDIGTDTCVISQAKRGGIDTVLDEASKRKTATMVSFQGNERFIAAAAAPISKSNYKNTVRGFKRLIGRSWDDPSVQAEISRLPNKDKFVKLPSGDVGVKVNYNDKEETFTMEQIMAMLINKLRWCVNKSSDLPSDVVLSIPGWWNEKQRRALLNSCDIAGFHALRLLNDHTAVALSYGIYKSASNVFDPEKQQKVMFIDIGHSNMSVAIVGFVQGKLQVLSAAYDPNLGGRNFDDLIFEKFVAEFKEKHKLDLKTNPKSCLKLYDACQKAKHTLTPEGVNLAKITVEYLMNEIDFRSELKLEDFQELSEDLLEKLKIPIEEALAGADVEVKDLTAIEIVGGGTRPKIVKQALSKHLGLDQSLPNLGLSTTLNADEAVAKGCALNSAMLSPVFRVKEFNVFDVVSLPVTLTWEQATNMAIETSGDEENGTDATGTNSVTIVQSKQSTPCTKRVTFRRTKEFEIKAKYETSLAGTQAKYLPPNFETDFGSFKVKVQGNKKKPKEVPMIRVDFSLDRNGLFNLVSAEELHEVVEPPPKKEKKSKKTKEKPKEEDKKEKKADENKMEEDEDKMDEKNGENPENEDKATKDENKEAEAKEEEKKPVKKKWSKKKIVFESHFHYGLSEKELTKMKQAEQMFTEADRKIAATAEAKNELESYIYSFRDKVGGLLSEFVTEQEKTSFVDLLTKEESWLYDDGYDETREEYLKRLNKLKEFGDKYETRLNEFDKRPSVIAALKEKIASFNSVINSTEEKFDHIKEEEREKVRTVIKETETWLHEQITGQEKLGKTEDPVLTCAMVTEKMEKLQRVASPVVNKKRPPPPKKEEPKDKPKEEESKKEEAKPDTKEGDANDNPEENGDAPAGETSETAEGMEVD